MADFLDIREDLPLALGICKHHSSQGKKKIAPHTHKSTRTHPAGNLLSSLSSEFLSQELSFGLKMALKQQGQLRSGVLGVFTRCAETGQGGIVLNQKRDSLDEIFGGNSSL